MRAREFINEVSPIEIQSGPDIHPELRKYSKDAALSTLPDKREPGEQDIIGGPSLPRQMKAIQVTAPSLMHPGRGTAGAVYSPPNHDKITPTLRVKTDLVKNSEPLEKTSLHPQVDRMIDKLKSGKAKDIPPVTVKKTDSGYQVIDGHHRLAAHQKAGTDTMRVRVVDPKNLKTVPNWLQPKDEMKFLKPGFDPKADTFTDRPFNLRDPRDVGWPKNENN